MSITNSIANEKSTQGDKFDLLMNKFTQLEEAFKEERRIRVTQETELKNLKKITMPNLEKQLEDKENLLKSTFIEKIKIEKMMNNNLKSELVSSIKSAKLNLIFFIKIIRNFFRIKMFHLVSLINPMIF